LIYVGVTIWSVATALCGFAQSFWHLVLARGGVGAGEASLNPCATSMISDMFPRDRLTSALAVYSIGATVGSGTALAVGGVIIHYVSGLGEIVLPVIGPLDTWQAVFIIVGLPGALLAFTVFTMPEPARRGRGEELPGGSWRSTYVDLMRFMRTCPRFFLCHYTGFTLGMAVVAGSVAWYPVHMLRSFDWSEGRVGVLLGATLMIGGIVGKLVCGWAVDSMYRHGYRDAQFRWYAGSLLLATPIGIFATTSGSPWVFLGGLAVFVMLTTSIYACALSSLNLVTPNEMRGTGVAVFTTVAALLGASVGSVVIPSAAQYIFQSETAIGLGMATLIAGACPLGAAALVYGAKYMREAMTEAER
jgi:MFS family permease